MMETSDPPTSDRWVDAVARLGRRVETQALLAAAHPDNTQTWPGVCRSLFFFFLPEMGQGQWGGCVCICECDH